jgi:competence protein ComEA
MRSRQRGAAWLLALLLAGRIIDRLEMPFEKRAAPSDSLASEAVRSDVAEESAASAATSGDAEGSRPPAARADSAPSRPSGERPPLAPVAINRAAAADLQRLPGVGPVLAERIIAHREAHGPFRGLADLGAVRGIGPRTCARLAPLVRFD